MSTAVWETASLRLVDPRALLIDQNARTIVDLEAEDSAFIDSVRTNGVVLPVIANPTEDGELRVKDGHKRTIAAILTDQPRIPVIVTDAGEQQDWQRLIDQWIANEVRAGFSAGDKARILEELTLFGISAEDIARQLGIGADTVDAGLRVRRSTTATEVAAQYPQLDMFQVAALAEFDDDADALDALRATLDDDPDQFDQKVSALRLERREHQARAELADQLRQRGVELGEPPSWGDPAKRLSELQRSAHDATVLGEEPEAHARCPGHAAYITSSSYTGEAKVTFVCRDWRRHGHVDRFASGRPAGRRKTAREKVELRRVKVNNKAWRAAEPVRRDFLVKLLGRKNPPKRVQQFLAASLVEGDPTLRKAMERQHGFACELLNLVEPGWGRPHPLAARLSRATANQAVMTQLTVVLAACEAACDVHTWRHPTAAHRRYLAALIDWGYVPSKVERLVLDPNADAEDWPSLRTSDSGGTAAATDLVDEPGEEIDALDDLDGAPETFDDRDDAEAGEVASETASEVVGNDHASEGRESAAGDDRGAGDVPDDHRPATTEDEPARDHEIDAAA